MLRMLENVFHEVESSIVKLKYIKTQFVVRNFLSGIFILMRVFCQLCRKTFLFVEIVVVNIIDLHCFIVFWNGNRGFVWVSGIKMPVMNRFGKFMVLDSILGIFFTRRFKLNTFLVRDWALLIYTSSFSLEMEKKCAKTLY